MEWMALRQACENEARLRESAEEVSLRQIYEVIAEHLDWDQEKMARARDAEFLRELRDIRPIAPAIEEMRKIEAMGKDVVVVSDTYFSGTQLAELLRRCGCGLPPEFIFASSDYRLTKRTGRLFKAVLEAHKLSPDQLCHIGDQPVADGRAPANLGIRGAITDAFSPTRYERLFAQSNGDDHFVCSAVAGCARTSRLGRAFEDPNDRAIWSVGCDVAGPLLLTYALWVLSQARTQGIARIYFLARDGEILLQVARRLCHWLGWTIDCRYLYASRQSFAFPALGDIDQASLHWLVDWSERPTLRVILKRLALAPGEIQEELVGAGFLPSNWDRGLSVAEVGKLMGILKEPQIRGRILGAAQSYRRLLLDYLRQEGLTDGASWALCDIGWRGLIQASLDRITENHPDFPKRYGGFYFGLNTDVLLIERSRADVFQSANMAWASWIMDIFCAAEHGSVNRFERQSDGTVKPVLAVSAENVSHDRTTSTQQAAILGFVDELTKTLDPRWAPGLLDIMRTRALNALRLMLRRPSRDEAEAYGRLELHVGTTHDSKIAVAPILTSGRLLHWLLARDRTEFPWIYWPEATIQRSVRSKSLQSALHLVERSRLHAARIKTSLRLR